MITILDIRGWPIIEGAYVKCDSKAGEFFGWVKGFHSDEVVVVQPRYKAFTRLILRTKIEVKPPAHTRRNRF